VGREAKARQERREQRAARARRAPHPEEALGFIAQQRAHAVLNESLRVDAERRAMAAAGWTLADG